MVDAKTLDKTSTEALSQFINDRMLLIGEATGNLMVIGSRKFIITCEHVATDYFANEFRPVVLRKNVKILKDDLKLIISHKELDIAVIEIMSDVELRGAYTLEDLLVIDNFSNYEFGDTRFILCGLPYSISFTNEYGRNYIYLLFATLLHKIQPQTEESLILQYPNKEETIDIRIDKKTILPDPRGVSGSFILAIKPFEDSVSQIWQPKPRVVAVQHSWHKTEGYVRGSNIKYLKEMLKAAKVI